MELGLQAATDISDIVATGIVDKQKEFRPMLKLKSKGKEKAVSQSFNGG